MTKKELKEKKELYLMYTFTEEVLYERLMPLMKRISAELTSDGPKVPQVLDFVVAAVEEKVAYMSQGEKCKCCGKVPSYEGFCSDDCHDMYTYGNSGEGFINQGEEE